MSKICESQLSRTEIKNIIILNHHDIINPYFEKECSEFIIDFCYNIINTKIKFIYHKSV
jgi:hypothetical protein